MHLTTRQRLRMRRAHRMTDRLAKFATDGFIKGTDFMVLPAQDGRFSITITPNRAHFAELEKRVARIKRLLDNIPPR